MPSARMTRDIDLVLELNETHPEAFIRLFENEKDFYFDPKTIATALSQRTMFNLIHNGARGFMATRLALKTSVSISAERARKLAKARSS
jgi:hypothetical protein